MKTPILPEVVVTGKRRKKSMVTTPSIKDAINQAFMQQFMNESGLFDDYDDDDTANYLYSNLLLGNKMKMPVFKGGKDGRTGGFGYQKNPPVDPLVTPLNINLDSNPIEYEMPHEEEPIIKVQERVIDKVASPKEYTVTDAKNDIRNFYVNDFAQRRQKYHPTETPIQVGNLFDNAPVGLGDLRSGAGGTYNSGNITISKRLNDNSKRSTIVHEMRHLMHDQLGGLTPEESQILHDAYNLKADKDYQYLEDEYPTTNTELRYKISRDYNNATGEELNKIIQGLSDDNLINRVSWVNGYIQIPDKILTPKNDKQRLEQKKKADAIRKALMEVAFNPVQKPFSYAAEGGSVHVKPRHRGRLT